MMTTTEFGTPMLSGANNEHTVGRKVDTYDRGFGGPEGSGLADTVDQTDRSILRNGTFTGSGYHQDGFVVDDDEMEEVSSEDDTSPMMVGRRITRSATGPVVTRSMVGGLDPDVEESQIPGAGLDAAMAEEAQNSDEEMDEEGRKSEHDRRFREDLCDRGLCGDNCELCCEDEAEESEWDSEPESEDESEDDSDDE